MAGLLKSRFVLKLEERNQTNAHFAMRSDDNPFLVEKELVISIEDWVDFGQPRELTVTVRPGDLLNAVQEREAEKVPPRPEA